MLIKHDQKFIFLQPCHSCLVFQDLKNPTYKTKMFTSTIIKISNYSRCKKKIFLKQWEIFNGMIKKCWWTFESSSLDLCKYLEINKSLHFLHNVTHTDEQLSITDWTNSKQNIFSFSGLLLVTIYTDVKCYHAIYAGKEKKKTKYVNNKKFFFSLFRKSLKAVS